MPDGPYVTKMLRLPPALWADFEAWWRTNMPGAGQAEAFRAALTSACTQQPAGRIDAYPLAVAWIARSLRDDGTHPDAVALLAAISGKDRDAVFADVGHAIRAA